jgi:hypothetical protein
MLNIFLALLLGGGLKNSLLCFGFVDRDRSERVV